MYHLHQSTIGFIALLFGVLSASYLSVVTSGNQHSSPFGQRIPLITVVAEELLGPIGLEALPGGGVLIAEEGSGNQDRSAGVTLITADGRQGRLISGLPSTRDAGDLAGVPLVKLSPDGASLYIGSFGQGHLWTLPVPAGGFAIPETPHTPDQLSPALTPLNNVRLVNPFDMTFDADGLPVVADASENGVAKATASGATRFIHRFERLPHPDKATDIEAVPTGITEVAGEYFVTLFGGCPYPAESGRLVAINEKRNQRTILDGLNLPIDIARAADDTLWLLEFARFTPGASCFDGSGYQAETGRLSRLSHQDDGTYTRTTVLDNLNFPGAVLPMPDGRLYISEVFAGRVIQITFDQPVAASSPYPNTSAPAPLITFTNRATDLGLTFQQSAFQTRLSMDPVAAMGGGLCWLDYDNDGWLDLYMVNSHALPEAEHWETQGGLPRNGLYRNKQTFFVNVAAAAGADLTLRGNGCVAADFNNDGWSDIYITADGPNRLLWNNGDGTFTEGGAAAGVDATEWNSAAIAGDLNADGLLDLFVAAYIDLKSTIPNPTGHFPQDYYGLPDRLYLNNGIGSDGRATFRDGALEAGLTRTERGLGALLSDLDRDGDLDLYIANDGHPNRVYANEPYPGGVAADPLGLGFRLRDLTGSADAGDRGSGMGVAGGDWDGDAQIDLFVTNWDTELHALYRNDIAETNSLTFQYSTYRIGLAGLGNGDTGWGTHLFDFDHDTDLDLLTVNGHVPMTDYVAHAEPVRLYRNRTADRVDGRVGDRAARFVDGSAEVGLNLLDPLHARGSAVADFDNDGDLDVAINQIGGQAVLLVNNAAAAGSTWLVVDAGRLPGTLVTVSLPDGRLLVREVYAGSSYLASEDPRLHFGLGTATEVDVIVRWPDGSVKAVSGIATKQHLAIAPD